MNKSIIFFDVTTKLINPKDEVFIDKKLVEIFIDYDKSIDEVLTNIFIENLVIEEYTNIIFPACFGKVLADFLGLRFATHIRCTFGINQHKNIFLYSFNGIKDYFSSESFNILKTEGVFLIDYDVNTIVNNSLVENEYLSKEKIINEIKKLNIQIPLNYEDNHSIANEWAIYRWSQFIGANDKNIEKIIEHQKSNLYFKYLKTIYPINHLDKLTPAQLKISNQENPKILYIDDEAEKGWYEIFRTILERESKLHFRHLDNEFNEKSKEEIIDISLKKIIEDDIDLVVLDFRLHKDDFENIRFEEVTGYQILKKIKEHNKGIQVIIFSATNKVWNLQAFQEAGSDGFIVKESPENSIDSEFTKQSIENLINTIDKCFNNIFLKDFYTKLEILKGDLIPRKNYKKSNKPLPKEFVDETLKWYELSLSFLNTGINEEQLISTFLIYFTIIENISNRVIEVENPIKEGDFYKFQFRKNLQRLNNYIEDNQNLGFYRKTNSKYKSSKRNLRWDIKIYNTIDFISDNKLSIESINVLVKKRNDIIHSNSTFGNVIEIKKDDILLLNKIIYEGLMNVI